jgi:dTMP kinase
MSFTLDSAGRGKFIVVEGSDGSGKHTQATLLLKHLKLRQLEIELLSFPKYDTPFGELVAKYLRGEYGSLNDLTPEIPAMLYAIDRFQIKDTLEKGLTAGHWFIADRYTQSNLGHQGAKFSGTERKLFIGWLAAMESRLPQPDLVVYLHVPVEVSQELMKNRQHKDYMGDDKTQDIHEVDTDYQHRVVETYLELAADQDNWIVIDCIDKHSGELYTIENIHRKIVQVVTDKLGL